MTQRKKFSDVEVTARELFGAFLLDVYRSRCVKKNVHRGGESEIRDDLSHSQRSEETRFQNEIRVSRLCFEADRSPATMTDVVALSDVGNVQHIAKSTHRNDLGEELGEELSEEGGEGLEARSVDESSEGSLVDFLIKEDVEEEDASEDESVELSKEESLKRDLDGIDQSNVVQGKRPRRRPNRLEEEVFRSAEYRKMMLCDVPKEDVDAMGEEEEGDEEYEEEDEDEEYQEEDEDEEYQEEDEDEEEEGASE